jgi:pimeloyl-ACP methyl ester carboxylesterase
MPTSPYQLRDMAGDAVGLLDALGIRAAHVVGASMGGMIAQEMAIRHPSRVLSLTSIMSTTGDPSLPRAAPQVVTQLFKPPPLEREPYVAHVVELFRVIGAGAMPFDEERTRRNAGRAWDRCLDPSGAARQMLAIVTSGSRKPELAHVKAPTVVIHGDADPLVPPAAGEDTARSIPGAKLVTIPGMGHALPEKAWPRIIDAIVDNAARAKP